MKKIYMIWDDYLGNIGICFENEDEAKKFASLKNFCYVKSADLYENVKDYKNENKGEYIDLLEDTIKRKAEQIKDLEDGFYVSVKIHKCFYRMYSAELERYINGNKKPYIDKAVETDETQYGFDYYSFEYDDKFLRDNIKVFVNKYNDKIETIKQYKKELSKLKKEYLKLKTEKSNIIKETEESKEMEK